VTAVTNFALAGEVFGLAALSAKRKKARFSAAWFWSGFLTLLGAGALLGGIDHGFLEPYELPRYWIQRSTWIVLGAMTFCLLVATARQFFPPSLQRIALAAAIAQFAASTVVSLLMDSFLNVVLNYVPAMFLLAGMNVAGLKRGAGSPDVIAGILVLFAASGVQAAGFDALSPLDHNGLYHVISMMGVVFLYRGGTRLRTAS
jgi:hypothetical protein